MSRALVLFRDDFRLADHPAFSEASEGGREVLCLHVVEEATGLRALGGAARWWLHGAIRDLRESLQKLGGDLFVTSGKTQSIVCDVVEKFNITDVYAHLRYEQAARQIDEALQNALEKQDVTFHAYHANVLRPPEALKNGAGQAYKVFSSFWRAFQASGPIPSPIPAPKSVTFLQEPHLNKILPPFDEACLKPTKPNWARQMAKTWTPGEGEAQKRLSNFVKFHLADYNAHRNFPDREATSRLSPYLRFGHLSPKQIFHALPHTQSRGKWRFESEIGWRDFAISNLVHNPEMPRKNLRRQFDKFEWQDAPKMLVAWQRGQTGIPIVDAGMRELWQTGWMHNRVRMIVGSFLTKHLLTRWQEGEQWFWDTLVDADLASNAMNWQWVAGTGIDAAPYFRIFNPVLQGEKFDKNGAYVRKYVPELAKLPEKYIHHPWDAPENVFSEAGITYGTTYPRPCLDLKDGRTRALEAFKKL